MILVIQSIWKCCVVGGGGGRKTVMKEFNKSFLYQFGSDDRRVNKKKQSNHLKSSLQTDTFEKYRKCIYNSLHGNSFLSKFTSFPKSFGFRPHRLETDEILP